jgi:hypothetical protein
MDSRENCWKFFIERVQRQLKVQKDWLLVMDTARGGYTMW